jgi:hypothetical protein
LLQGYRVKIPFDLNAVLIANNQPQRAGAWSLVGMNIGLHVYLDQRNRRIWFKQAAFPIG